MKNKTFQIYAVQRAFLTNKLLNQKQLLSQRLCQSEAERKRTLHHKFNTFNKLWPTRNKLSKSNWELLNPCSQRQIRFALRKSTFTWVMTQNLIFVKTKILLLVCWLILMHVCKLRKMRQNKQKENGLLICNLSL